MPSSERDDAGVRAISATIDKARSEGTKARSELARRFPSYAELIDPKAPTVEQIRETPRPGEASSPSILAALSAPSVADVEGDGLLTMEEVLALKLDSDWVVLSACNTATGAEAGAEAVSGLGRAFFYAGSRALLVTNWAVMSDAATALTTGTFRRQDPTLARAEALRQAMLDLIDGPGYVYAGKTVYTYAHPLFWAPYSIIGDGGAR